MALVAAQAIDTGEISIGTLDNLFLPSDTQGFFAAVIGLQVDLIMLTDAVLLFSSTAYPFPQIVGMFFGAGSLQPCVYGVEFGFKTTGEAFRHGLFLLFTAGRMAIEPDFLPVFGDYLLAAHRFLGGGFQRG